MVIGMRIKFSINEFQKNISTIKNSKIERDRNERRGEQKEIRKMQESYEYYNMLHNYQPRLEKFTKVLIKNIYSEYNGIKFTHGASR